MRFLESLLRINCLKMGLSSSQLEKEIASDQLLSGERYFGLVNFGNTCYCNSVIQALFFCKPFRDKVLQYNDRAKNPKKETLLTCLSDLFYSVVSQQRRVGQMRPKKFIQKLKRENGLFDNYLQQDAHEFLNYLLNKIADIIRAEQQSTEVEGEDDSNDSEVTDVSENMKKHNGRNWIHEIFQGSLTNETRCLNCDNVRTKEENFLDLSVDVGENVDISYCLRCFSETETMRSDNKYYCEFCRCKQEAQRRMRIKKPPLLLALHLKRFKYSENLNRFIKLSYRVAFPMELRLFNTVSYIDVL
ncbi:Ubiquitin carboxyl-terminal hydrolase 46 isoform 2 [Schistosoma japonicum]|uniref:ubiquitinyl hydrolase 1 n=1 Tax=Schistosoma japonicum TaxID=6182 RepID=A0A4Z2DQX0_SCHJA|nr:Ubiquitin carboxyl-terminal hydrolase 46 [Schistosoma japonicum]KAH8876842.1 Ubiquitin carboxyl-terminal hydrolase 46 [Schistosoma japonicum]TNN18869.1 Ubiquitin carboxyl-terminal hydrolase 46 isoform 2 [Schistosoma japonicum]